MLSNNTATFSRSKFSPQYHQKDIVGDSYLLRHHLESDEFSRLYTARNIHTKEFVHVRVFTGYFSRFLSDKTLFLNELKYMSDTSADACMKIIDMGEVDDSIFVVWPYERLESLNELSKKIGVFNKDDALVIINEVLKALKVLYSEFKEPHLCFGMANIYVNNNGEVKICDYGISSYLLNRYPFFNIKNFHEYIAPELNRDALNNASRGSDVFILACILFRMITGRVPELMVKSQQYCFIFNEIEKVSLGEDFLKVFQKMSEPSPKDRYNTYSEIQSSIQAILSNEKVVFDQDQVSEAREHVKLGDKKFLFSDDFQSRIAAVKNVADFIKSDAEKKEGRYIFKVLFYAILLLFSTFLVLVKFTLEKS